MAIVSDNAADRELIQMKKKFEELKRVQMTFGNTFQTLPPKEKARQIGAISEGHKEVARFIDKTRTMEIYNSGTKFGIENLKQGLQSLISLWKKVQRQMEVYGAGSGGNTSQDAGDASDTLPNTPDDDPLRSASQNYSTILAAKGHALSAEQTSAFESKLKEAYTQASQQYAGRKIEISVHEEAGKIKIKMVPK